MRDKQWVKIDVFPPYTRWSLTALALKGWILTWQKLTPTVSLFNKEKKRVLQKFNTPIKVCGLNCSQRQLNTLRRSVVYHTAWDQSLSGLNENSTRFRTGKGCVSTSALVIGPISNYWQPLMFTSSFFLFFGKTLCGVSNVVTSRDISSHYFSFPPHIITVHHETCTVNECLGSSHCSFEQWHPCDHHRKYDRFPRSAVWLIAVWQRLRSGKNLQLQDCLFIILDLQQVTKLYNRQHDSLRSVKKKKKKTASRPSHARRYL